MYTAVTEFFFFAIVIAIIIIITLSIAKNLEWQKEKKPALRAHANVKSQVHGGGGNSNVFALLFLRNKLFYRRHDATH